MIVMAEYLIGFRELCLAGTAVLLGMTLRILVLVRQLRTYVFLKQRFWARRALHMCGF